MIAAVCTWHEHHDVATEEISNRLNRGEPLVAAAPALVEAYAVLTRLPAPHRLKPDDAWTLLKTNFVESARVVALPNSAYVKLLDALAKQSIGGGRTYDAVIAECGRQAAVGSIVTLNRRHFDPPPPEISVIDPSER